MWKMRKVDEYYDTSNAASPDTKLLTTFFTNCTNYQNKLLFSSIYLPVRQFDTQTQKLAEEYTYLNVGLTAAELADLYWAEYSGNFLIGYHKDDIAKDLADITTRANAIFKKNIGKYLKLIELEGLEWNPLWNVDGIELHQIIEQHADEFSKDTGSEQSFRGQHVRDKHDVSAYDSGTKTEWQETRKGQAGSQKPSASSTVGNISVTSTTGSIPAVSESEASANSSVNVKSHASFGYAVSLKDTAFGVALDGGDTLHTEKNIRQGNIGVTKTTELIEDARKTISYSIVQEFFNDINEVILVGVWDN